MIASSTASYERFAELRKALAAACANMESNVYFRYSALWSTLIKSRTASETFNDYTTFLNDTTDRTHGVAGKLHESEKKRFVTYYANFVAPADILELPSSMVGAPSILDYQGVAGNTSQIENLGKFLQLRRLLAAFLPGHRKLHIAEIGAGYGGLATLLVQSGLTASYTIIDLPENLSLSSYYLTQQFPKFRFEAPSRHEPLPYAAPETFYFIAPGNIDALDACRFDLIINTDSLGEMPRETAKAYVSWISEHLVPDGCFYTLNGHRRSADAVQRASEFGYDRLTPLHLGGRPIASALFDDHSHEMLLTKARASSGVDGGRFDVICDLYALGLHQEMAPLSVAFVRGELTNDQSRFLADVQAGLAAPLGTGKFACLSEYQTEELNACRWFLNGLACHLAGDKEGACGSLNRYLSACSSYIGEAFALFVLVQREGPGALKRRFRCGAKTSYFVDEIERICTARWPFRSIFFALRNELLRKKLSLAVAYRPSPLLRVKNIFLNAKEGRGLRSERY